MCQTLELFNGRNGFIYFIVTGNHLQQYGTINITCNLKKAILELIVYNDKKPSNDDTY